MNLIEKIFGVRNQLRPIYPESLLVKPSRTPVPPKGDYLDNVEKAYNKNVVVAACVGVMSSSMSEAPLTVYRNDAHDYSHPLSLLFAKPNRFDSSAKFIQKLWMFLGIGGNAYIIKSKNEYGKTVEMYVYSPAQMIERLSADGRIEGYVYKGVTQDQDRFYEVDEVIHITHPLYTDPISPWRGLSPIDVAWTKIQTYNELDGTQYSLLADNAIPPGAFKASADAETMTEEQKTALKRHMRDKRNAKDVLVLQGMDYIPMGLDMVKLGSSELIRELEIGICSAFRIHPLVAMTAAGLATSTYSNLQSAYTEFTTLTRQPFWNSLEEQFEQGFATEYPSITLEYDMAHVAALRADPDVASQTALAQFTANLITQNEARTFSGLDIIDDGDKFAYEVAPAPTFGSFSKDVEQDIAVVESFDETEQRVKWIETEAAKYWKSVDSEIQKATKKINDSVIEMFEAMERKALSGKGFKAVITETDTEEYLELFLASSGVARKQLFNAMVASALQSIAAHPSEIQSDFDDLQREAEKIVTAKVNEALGTARADISKVLAETQGKPVSFIRDALKAQFTTLKGGRATAIATTTTKAQASTTQLETWKKVDARTTNPKRKLKSVWLSRRDDQVRPSHEKMDGKVVDLGEEFTFPDGSKRTAPALGEVAGEDINCRCIIRAVRAGNIKQ